MTRSAPLLLALAFLAGCAPASAEPGGGPRTDIRLQPTGVFGPGDVSGLASWYDPSNSASITGTAPVTVVADLAGSSDLDSTVGGGPDLTSGWLVFDGTADIYTSAPTVTDYPFTVYCVFRTASSTTGYGRQAIWSLTDVSTANVQIEGITDGTGTGNPCSAYASNSGGSSTSDTTKGYFTSEVHLLTVVATSATARTVYLDNADGATDTTSVTLSGIDTFALGAEIDTVPSAYADAEIGEVLVYSAAITGADNTAVVGYLADRWGFTDGGVDQAFPYATNLTNSWVAWAGLTLSGSEVTTWADQTGSIDLDGGIIHRPDYNANALNGRDGVRFTSANNDHMSSPTPFITASTGQTIVILGVNRQSAANLAWIGAYDSGASTDRYTIRTSGSGGNGWGGQIARNSNVDVSAAGQTANADVLTIGVVQYISPTSRTARGADNATGSFATVGTSATSVTPTAANMDATVMGRRELATPDWYLDADVMGVWVYSETVSDANLYRIKHWAETYYGSLLQD